MKETTTDVIDNKIVAVCYIDGSAKPTNPGPYGCGVHGYIYSTDTLGKSDSNKPNKYIISDTGYIEVEEANKKVFQTVIPTHYINGYSSNSEKGTNNRGELEAFIVTARAIADLKDILVNHIIFKSDSEYAIHIIRLIFNNDLKIPYDKIKVNLDICEKIIDVLHLLKKKNITFETIKVLGHSTALGNHLSDRLANLASSESYKGNANTVFNITPAKGYWKFTLDRHPFLLYRQLFFINTYRKQLKEFAYAVMKYDKDDEPGTKSHEASFGLVILKNKPVYIEEAITEYQSNLGSTSIISTVNLDNLYKQQTAIYYNIFGKSTFSYNPRGKILSSLDEIPIVHDIQPPGLATRAIDKVMELNNIINSYKSNTKSSTVIFKDITDYIYGVDAKGKPITKIENGSTKALDIDINIDGTNIKIPLDLGKDLLERNHLKRIEKELPKVTIVIFNVSPSCLEYYTIVEMQTTGDISIWCNFYNNKIYI